MNVLILFGVAGIGILVLAWFFIEDRLTRRRDRRREREAVDALERRRLEMEKP